LGSQPGAAGPRRRLFFPLQAVLAVSVARGL